MCDIYDNLFSELINIKLMRLKHSDRYTTYSKQVVELSEKLQEVFDRILPEDAETVKKYIDETALLADMDCKFLYISGAMDSIRLWELFRTL